MDLPLISIISFNESCLEAKKELYIKSNKLLYILKSISDENIKSSIAPLLDRLDKTVSLLSSKNGFTIPHNEINRSFEYFKSMLILDSHNSNDLALQYINSAIIELDFISSAQKEQLEMVISRYKEIINHNVGYILGKIDVVSGVVLDVLNLFSLRKHELYTEDTSVYRTASDMSEYFKIKRELEDFFPDVNITGDRNIDISRINSDSLIKLESLCERAVVARKKLTENATNEHKKREITKLSGLLEQSLGLFYLSIDRIRVCIEKEKSNFDTLSKIISKFNKLKLNNPEKKIESEYTTYIGIINKLKSFHQKITINEDGFHGAKYYSDVKELISQMESHSNNIQNLILYKSQYEDIRNEFNEGEGDTNHPVKHGLDSINELFDFCKKAVHLNEKTANFLQKVRINPEDKKRKAFHNMRTQVIGEQFSAGVRAIGAHLIKTGFDRLEEKKNYALRMLHNNNVEYNKDIDSAMKKEELIVGKLRVLMGDTKELYSSNRDFSSKGMTFLQTIKRMQDIFLTYIEFGDYQKTIVLKLNEIAKIKGDKECEKQVVGYFLNVVTHIAMHYHSIKSELKENIKYIPNDINGMHVFINHLELVRKFHEDIKEGVLDIDTRKEYWTRSRQLTNLLIVFIKNRGGDIINDVTYPYSEVTSTLTLGEKDVRLYSVDYHESSLMTKFGSIFKEKGSTGKTSESIMERVIDLIIPTTINSPLGVGSMFDNFGDYSKLESSEHLGRKLSSYII